MYNMYICTYMYINKYKYTNNIVGNIVLSTIFMYYNRSYKVSESSNVSNSKYILKPLPTTLPSLLKPMEIELTPDTSIIISVLLGTVPQYLVP